MANDDGTPLRAAAINMEEIVEAEEEYAKDHSRTRSRAEVEDSLSDLTRIAGTTWSSLKKGAMPDTY